MFNFGAVGRSCVRILCCAFFGSGGEKEVKGQNSG
jgi:hypothetical protein